MLIAAATLRNMVAEKMSARWLGLTGMVRPPGPAICLGAALATGKPKTWVFSLVPDAPDAPDAYTCKWPAGRAREPKG